MSIQMQLEQLQVAKPCPADWDQMTGDDRVRHCDQCDLNVYNLSDMTRRDAETLIQQNEGQMCVQLYKRHDGTVITADCPRGVAAAARRIVRKSFAAAVLVLVMLFGGAWALARHRSQTPGAANAGSSPIVQFNLIDYLLKLIKPVEPEVIKKPPLRLLGKMVCPLPKPQPKPQPKPESAILR